MANRPAHRHTVLRSLGLGLITGAADDDCSAIGTYAQAGAQFGYGILWTAPVTLPMMIAVVYLSAKLGQVTGEGLFSVLRRHAPRSLLYTVLAGVLVGNIIEAGADIGGMAAALAILVHVPQPLLLIGITTVALVLQIWGSYAVIRNVLRVLAMSLLAYVFSAFLAHPKLAAVVHGTLVPTLHFNRDFLSILVAIIGTSLSAYLYTWQSNEEVEEKIAAGQVRLEQRRGTTDAELRTSFWDVAFGMLFSNVVMFFIILATAATLFVAGHHTIHSAADAAQSLRPLAGNFAGLLFSLGIIGVGFLAIPVMTTGAAYDLCQSTGCRNGLSYRPREARLFYGAITLFTLLAMGLNFLGINPMRALVVAGIVQGFSTPPLMLLIMLMCNRRSIMGDRVNGRAINVLGWITTALIFAASVCLVGSYLYH
ncbi:Nramp family divalent metal transporter [Acidipila sp. EB88]|uniref:Nramp family divalent metal transporter n=1 Tax=Acidipila sp. EB88 TaxID=2305226 RepID=UPI000F5E70B7|nr:Nramp family divalent metal transporter [Acidipila sp. EB88]RRA47352.1 divalent metal cation transporter [Acidipila sp. EB88]